MLRDSVVVVVVRTRPRAIPLAMITIRKSFMGFLFFPVMTMGLRLAALRAAGAPLLPLTHGLTDSKLCLPVGDPEGRPCNCSWSTACAPLFHDLQEEGNF